MKTIKIKPEHKTVVKSFNEKLESAQAGFREASKNLKNAHKYFWETIYELYPEAAKGEKGFFDHEKMVINVFYGAEKEEDNSK